MTFPRLITRRRAKWVGVVAAITCVALFVATIWIEPTVWAGDEDFGLLLQARRGQVSGGFRFGDGDGREVPYAHARIKKSTPIEIDVWFHFDKIRIESVLVTNTTYFFAVPLWLPMIAIVIPTAYLWHTDRRAKPWQCAKCRYDLRGLDGGVCPECGGPSTESHSTPD